MYSLVWESEFSVVWLCSSHTNAEQVNKQKAFVHGIVWPGPSIPSLLLTTKVHPALAACWVQLQVSASRLWPIIATYPFPPTLWACLWAFKQTLSHARTLLVCLLPCSLFSPPPELSSSTLTEGWDCTAHSATWHRKGAAQNSATGTHQATKKLVA